MKPSIHFLCFIATVLLASAEPLATFDWSAIEESGEPLPGKIVTEDGRTALLIQNTNQTPLQVQLLKIENPGITAKYFTLTGEIRYEGVRGDGFLEMWSIFPPTEPGAAESRYFSRTFGDSGEMGKITGTSAWRPFLLPFNISRSAARPSALEVNLILPGSGVVYIGPLRLSEFPAGASTSGASNAWWSDRTAGLIGGFFGLFVGCFASLMAWLASRRKARGFVLTSGWILVAIGAILTISGVGAVFQRQPYGVWFPLLLCGVLLVAIMPARLREFHRLYRHHELRRMEAADAA